MLSLTGNGFQTRPAANQMENLINPKELAKWLKHDRPKQQAVMSRLFVSYFTIQAWWQGQRAIPKQYQETLHQMMGGEIQMFLSLNPEVYNRLEGKAIENGFPNAQDFLSDLVEKIF